MVTKQSNGASHATIDLVSLADTVAAQTRAISDYLNSNNIAAPSFAPGCGELPNTAEYVTLYNSLKTALQDLERLVDGPKRWLRSFVCQGYDLAALQVAFELDFFGLVPAASKISIEELASAAGLDVDRTSRILRMLITHRIFQEPTPGFVAHSAASLTVHNDEDLKCAGGYTLDEMLKAVPATTDSLQASPKESDSTHCPFNTAHGVPMFRYYAERPPHAARFAKAMAGVAKLDRPITELRDFFPWGSLSGTVVDVGGGNGHISSALAQDFPHLHFVVQDGSTDMLAQGHKMLPPTLQGRVSFMQYDFFSPQPLRNAAAFVIRQCTHNWCDSDVVRIFKAFVPGLEASKPGTPLLINEAVVPEPGVWPAHEERLLRQMDILMLIGLGAKQRTRAEFGDLLKQADSRYEVKSVYVDGALGLLEVHLNR